MDGKGKKRRAEAAVEGGEERKGAKREKKKKRAAKGEKGLPCGTQSSCVTGEPRDLPCTPLSPFPGPVRPARTMSATKLFVGSLAWSVTDEALRSAFEPYGPVIEGANVARSRVKSHCLSAPLDAPGPGSQGHRRQGHEPFPRLWVCHV